LEPSLSQTVLGGGEGKTTSICMWYELTLSVKQQDIKVLFFRKATVFTYTTNNIKQKVKKIPFAIVVRFKT
jgi:hypothetical protein